MVQLNPTIPAKKFQDLTGIRFHRLKVICWAGRNRFGNHYWLCVCDCGNCRPIRSAFLKSGKARSCGCFCIDQHTTHGRTRKNKVIPVEYTAWVEMRRRCTQLHRKTAENYIGRGIFVCDRWIHSFANFYDDVGPKPKPHHKYSLERLNNNGGYEPGNVMWATWQQQASNKRNSRFITFNNRTQILTAWAREIGMNTFTLRSRVTHGWSIEKALLTPVRKR